MNLKQFLTTIFSVAIICALFLGYNTYATFISDVSIFDKNIPANEATVNSEGRQDVVQHAHVDEGWFHSHLDGLAVSTSTILIDISDTTNYPHSNTTSHHMTFFELEVDATTNANWEVNFKFLENCDATDCESYMLKHITGDRTTGNNLNLEIPFYPNGWQGISTKVVSHDVDMTDTDWQTDIGYSSTFDLTGFSTPAGSGDLVMEVSVSGGTVDFSVAGSYHGH